MALTKSAFDIYRKRWTPDQDIHPDAVRYDGDADKLTPAEGLLAAILNHSLRRFYRPNCAWISGGGLEFMIVLRRISQDGKTR
jgi:hypothetical protein